MTNPARPRNIFVVNDDPVQLLLLGRTLGFIPNVEVFTFSRAFEVLQECLRGVVPDLLVSALDMPELDGWRFCRLLRSPEYALYNTVPILICSATFSGDYVRRLVEDVGADDFVPAPFDPQAIRRHAEALLEKGGAVESRPVAVVAAPGTAALAAAFEEAGFLTGTAGTAAEVMEILARESADIVVMSEALESRAPEDWVKRMRCVAPPAALVLLVEHSDPDKAVRWMRAGVDALLPRSAAPEEVVSVARGAARIRSVLQVEARRRRLDDARRLHEKLFHEMPDGCAFLEFIPDRGAGLADFRVTDFNPAFIRILDVTARGVLGRTIRELLPHSARALIQLAERVVARGQSVERDLALSELGRFVEVRMFALSDSTGVAIFTDRTERYREAEARRSAERRFHTLIEAMNEGMVVIDARGRVTYANESMARMLGITVDTLKGARLDDYLERPASLEELTEKIQTAEPGHPVSEAVWRKAAGGKIVTVVSLRELPKNGDHAQAGAWLAVVADVSELAKAQRKAENLEQQLHQAQKMEAVGRLAGGVAHDFNNLLTVVMNGAAAALQSLPPDHDAANEIRLIRETARNAAKLTRQLLIFSRQSAWAPAPADLNEIVKDHLRLSRRLVGEDVRFRTELAPHPLVVTVDVDLLGQVLLNLSVNARDAMPRGGEIIMKTARVRLKTEDFGRLFGVETVRPGDYALLSFRDTGCGISEENQTRIFEPFFTTKGRETGTGLGLATVFGIVQRHNGYLGLKSAPGQGAEFLLYFPLSKSSVLPAKKSEQTGPADETGSESLTHRGTILLVEDQPLVRRVTQRMLQRMGYRVRAVAAGEEALRLVREHGEEIALLMTDIIMEGMDGAELARKVHALRPDVAIVFTSGYPGEWLRRRGVRELHAEFLSKPYSEADLAKAVRAALGADGTHGPGS